MQVIYRSYFKRCALGFVATVDHINNESTNQLVHAVLLQDAKDLCYLRCFRVSSTTCFYDEKIMEADNVSEAASQGTLIDVILIDRKTSIQKYQVEQRGVIRVGTSERTVFLTELEDGETEFVDFMNALKQAQQCSPSKAAADVDKEKHSSLTSSALSKRFQNISRTLSRKSTKLQDHVISHTSNPVEKLLEDDAWKVDVESLLMFADKREEFKLFLEFSFAGENMDFLEAVEEFEETSRASIEYKPMFENIIRQFIKPGSPKQVNLPYHISRSLLNTHIPKSGIFNSAKEEILDLIERNFLQRFVERTEERLSEQQQMASLSQCFMTMWHVSGVDAVYAINDKFESAGDDCAMMAQFFKARINAMEIEASSNFDTARNYAFPNVEDDDGNKLLHSYSITVNACSMRGKIITEYLKEMETYAQSPMQELSKTIQQTLDEIKARCKAPLREILNSRRDFERTQQELSRMRDEKLALEKSLSNGKSKKKKKSTKQLDLIVAKLEKAAQMNDAAQLDAVSIESCHETTLRAAVEQFESLELHRLDRAREILTQAALIELNLCNRLGLVTQPSLESALSVDPVGEMLAFAQTVGSLAHKSRPATLRR